MSQKIIWTKTDEAPALATVSLLPIINAFTRVAGVDVEESDISVAGRIIAAFPERLDPDQIIDDELSKLGELTQSPDANIIKLPNISASLPQLKAAIAELQNKGYNLPDYPDDPKNDEDKDIQARYSKILGSAVNPVLREGNSDRRSAAAVKNYAKKFPHSMGKWNNNSQSHVATMSEGDFRHNEKSMTLSEDTKASIVFTGSDGQEQVLKSNLQLHKGEVMDSTFMSVKKLNTFLREQIADANSNDLLFSLHLKATMMKVSDPIIFGHGVQVYFEELISKHKDTFNELEVNWNNGFGDLIKKLDMLKPDKKSEINADIQAIYKDQPDLAMVDSDRGITNLHVPSDIIIDASMPAAIRASGQMWNNDGQQQDTKFTIPDSTYAPLYQKTIENHLAHGTLDVTSAGSVANVGLMAKKAEEYGSHPTTFVVPGDGKIEILGETGNMLLSSNVEKDDIWRAVFVKDEAVRDWVKLAVNRARASEWPVIFWLDEDRPHTAELIKKVKPYLSEYDISGLDISILSVADAAETTIERLRDGKNTISATGNVLRDYITDLYPILELGTSAKMLSIVPLMKGGGLFETGAGGSAPKHVQQILKENHLRWDSLGEFLALTPSLEQVASSGNKGAAILADTLDSAIEHLLEENKSPGRKVHQIDNRGSHFYMAMYWARALANQNDDADLALKFKEIADALEKNESRITDELLGVQGEPADIGGYYRFSEERAVNVMRPSKTFNQIIDNFR